ncbi:MAG: PP2C family serine/threonine-protein phosphatase [Chloroflexota bacterium]
MVTRFRLPSFKKTSTQPSAAISASTYNPTMRNEWVIVGASVIGKDHRKHGLPCQDNFYYKVIDIDNGWGVAVVADGAGSAKNSHDGSEFVAQRATINTFGKLIKDKEWHKGRKLPSDAEWTLLAKAKWQEIRGAIEVFATRKGVESRSLACTGIVVVFSPNALLVTHIGDGRAGYQNRQREWKPLITPFRGEEANATIFLTSLHLNKESDYDKFVESRVIREPIRAFTLMSDGCEKHAFESSKLDNAGMWHDPNLPYRRFFDPLVETLLQMQADKTPDDEMLQKWAQFLESGTEGLENEPDDKTLILGVLA